MTFPPKSNRSLATTKPLVPSVTALPVPPLRVIWLLVAVIGALIVMAPPLMEIGPVAVMAVPTVTSAVLVLLPMRTLEGEPEIDGNVCAAEKVDPADSKTMLPPVLSFRALGLTVLLACMVMSDVLVVTDDPLTAPIFKVSLIREVIEFCVPNELPSGVRSTILMRPDCDSRLAPAQFCRPSELAVVLRYRFRVSAPESVTMVLPPLK